jgi:threonine dehydratase
MNENLPGLREIEAAAERIAGVASRTPLIESPALSTMTGHEVYLKLECFQPIRVFKIRGAYNKISLLRQSGVVAASSGNHGFAVAYSSRLLSKKCTVVVPETAVREKMEAIAEYGAEVVKAGRYSNEREAKAREIAAATGAAFVHPYNDPDVIAGQGTCGLEIAHQLTDVDAVLVPVGGGGLISGISTALKAIRPETRVYGVEPQGAPKLTEALKAKKVVTIPSPASVADGLIPSALGGLTYEACSKYVDGSFTVSEDDILRATRAMIREAKIIAEPSGAAPLAPLLSSTSRSIGRRVVLVVSGGNISHELLAKMVGPEPGRSELSSGYH